MANNQASKKNQEFLILINEQFRSILEGKSSAKLIKIIYDYELDPLALPIHKQPIILKRYSLALLLNRQYINLHLLLQRYNQIENFELLQKITMAAKRQNLKELVIMTENLIKIIPEDEKKLKKRIKSSLIEAILQNLSKYYLNISLKEFANLTGLKQEDVNEVGGNIKDGYIELKQQKLNVDCLQTKLRQLVLVASRMSQFE